MVNLVVEDDCQPRKQGSAADVVEGGMRVCALDLLRLCVRRLEDENSFCNKQ